MIMIYIYQIITTSRNHIFGGSRDRKAVLEMFRIPRDTYPAIQI